MAVEIEKFIKETLGRLPQIGDFWKPRLKPLPTSMPEQKLNPDYLRTVEVLEKAGLTVFPIEPKSLEQMAVEVNKDGKGYFDYIAPSGRLRKVVPEAATVAIDTQQITIPNSNYKDKTRQIKMIREWGEELKLRTGLTDKDIFVRMPHASEAVQLDILYQGINQGKKLYPNFWVRTLDEMAGPDVANVGRARPDDGLYVGGWYADNGDPNVWAFPVVVILQ